MPTDIVRSGREDGHVWCVVRKLPLIIIKEFLFIVAGWNLGPLVWTVGICSEVHGEALGTLLVLACADMSC